MSRITFISLLFFSVFIISNSQNLKSSWQANCKSDICTEGLDQCASSDCYGARECKAIIDEYYPACSLF